MKHVQALDGLRAVAVLVVMISHAGLGHIVPGGFGVTIFFFLSGFLITTLMRLEIQKQGRLSFSGFYLRRTVRIIPPMLICIAATLLLIGAGLMDRSIDTRWLWVDLVFLTNYAPVLGGSSNIPIPLWSLDVEEHFYLLFPALYVALKAMSDRAAVLGISAGLVLVLAIRIGTLQTTIDPANIFYWTHTRIDSILFGCLLAVFNNPVTDDRAWIGKSRLWFVIGLATIALTLVVRDPFFRESFRYSLQGIGLFLIFNFILRTSGVVNRALSLRPLHKATGAKVLIATNLPQAHISVDLTARFNQRRAELATILRTASWVDGVIDFAADSEMGRDGAAANLSRFADGVHPTDAGQQRLAGIYAPRVGAWVKDWR